ncbi:MAG: TraC family protein [Patescibacteria group bacterium]
MTKSESLPTQDVIEIDHLKNDVVVLKNGGFRKILLVSGLNFDLKSEDEKNLIIFTYQNFLNSLNFSVQQFVHSRKINIDDYLSRLAQRKDKESGGLIGGLIDEYVEFIRSLVSQNPIMSKTFFVVVPHDPVDIVEASKNIFNKITRIFKKTDSKPQGDTESISKANLEQLEQKADQVITGLSQIGLRVVPLNQKELEEFFYNLYNPETTERKKAL